MTARTLAALLVVLCGCPGTPPTPPRPPAPGSNATAPPPDAPPSPPVAKGPDDGECRALVAHAVAVEVARIKATRPVAERPTDPEVATLTAELAADPGCRTLSRRAYDCAMAAGSLAELEACYSTPSSSTSNNSVAPGGITPAAPRSP